MRKSDCLGWVGSRQRESVDGRHHAEYGMSNKLMGSNPVLSSQRITSH